MSSPEAEVTVRGGWNNDMVQLLKIPPSYGDVLFTDVRPIGDARDVLRLAVEGRDTDGLIRAGTLELSLDGELLAAEIPPSGCDDALPGLAGVNGELVAHAVGECAVVRHGELVARVVEPSRGEALEHRGILGAAIGQQAGFVTEAPTLTAPGVLVSRALPGEPLDVVDPHHWAKIWHAWIDLWPQFAAVETTAVAPYTPAEEARRLTEALDAALTHGVLIDTTGTARRSAARIADQLVSGTAQDALFAHLALGDDALHLAGETVGLQHFDAIAMAEPAVDLGLLGVHAVLRVAQGRWTQSQGDVVLHAVAEVAETLGVNATRMQLVQSATALRLAAELAYQPRWQEFAGQWLKIWLTKPVLR